MHYSACRTWRWPIREVLVVGLAYAACAALLAAAPRLPRRHWAGACAALMAAFPVVTWLWLGRARVEWGMAKAQTCVLAALVLTVMAMLNFSSAAVAAILLVPLFVVLLAPERGLPQVCLASPLLFDVRGTEDGGTDGGRGRRGARCCWAPVSSSQGLQCMAGERRRAGWAD